MKNERRKKSFNGVDDAKKKKTIKLISRQDCCICSCSFKLRLKRVSLSVRAFNAKTFTKLETEFCDCIEHKKKLSPNDLTVKNFH